MTKEELLAEEYICNGKCQDDITRNYVHCKTCTRLKDFLAGYKVGKTELEKENAELKEKYVKNITDCDICDTYCNSQLTKAKEIIREFVEWANWQGNSKCPSFKSIQNKAEQFISEVEK